MKLFFSRTLFFSFLLALVAALFCLWNAFGTTDTRCVTLGCALFQDVSIKGISLWFFGSAAFLGLAVCALLGWARLGMWCAALCVLLDAVLLVIMVLTVPCVNCLVAAIFFALLYILFRVVCTQQEREKNPATTDGGSAYQRKEEMPLFSLLLLFWFIGFIANAGSVIRAELGSWSMLGDKKEAAVHLYFSPSCESCRTALLGLAGTIDAAFYPVGESENDVAVIAQMIQQQQQGDNLYTALQKARALEKEGKLAFEWTPEMILLRFRMLRNRAHVFLSGAPGIPFVEYRGLPRVLADQAEKRREMGADDFVPDTPSLESSKTSDVKDKDSSAGKTSPSPASSSETGNGKTAPVQEGVKPPVAETPPPAPSAQPVQANDAAPTQVDPKQETPKEATADTQTPATPEAQKLPSATLNELLEPSTVGSCAGTIPCPE